MWSASHTVTVKDLTAEQVWRVWSDISIRHEWDQDMEWMRIDGEFRDGAVIEFKPVKGPKSRMTLLDCVPNKSFTDMCKFPLARMYGRHELLKTEAGLTIKTTMEVTGLLGWLVRKMLVEQIVAELPQQTEALIQLAKKQ